MGVAKRDLAIDVRSGLPEGHRDEGDLTVTAVFDAEAVSADPVVILATPGGTYHRRYWDLQPPGRTGYSKAEYLAERGVVFMAMDYFGGGDSSRPADGDFIGLEVQADAAHTAYLAMRNGLEAGTLLEELPALVNPTYVGIGQSLGGFITMIQQGKYADYPAVGIFGASPLVIANIRDQPDWDSMSAQERREWILEANAKTSGVDELPMYSGAPRENFLGIFHVLDVPDDLFNYDKEHCATLIPRYSGVDGMTPGLAQPFADQIDVPVFLAFGEIDVSADPRGEPAAYPASPDITTVVVPNMAHMHNFADTRVQLWDRFLMWLPILQSSN